MKFLLVLLCVLSFKAHAIVAPTMETELKMPARITGGNWSVGTSEEMLRVMNAMYYDTVQNVMDGKVDTGDLIPNQYLQQQIGGFQYCSIVRYMKDSSVLDPIGTLDKFIEGQIFEDHYNLMVNALADRGIILLRRFLPTIGRDGRQMKQMIDEVYADLDSLDPKTVVDARNRIAYLQDRCDNILRDAMRIRKVAKRNIDPLAEFR